MKQSEKFIKRLQSIAKDKPVLITLRVLVNPDGELELWIISGAEEAEGAVNTERVV